MTSQREEVAGCQICSKGFISEVGVIYRRFDVVVEWL